METFKMNDVSKVHPTNDLIIAKVVAMTVLGVTSFLIGTSPIKITKLFAFKSKNCDDNLLISLLLCFGGGVLLFTTFIHLQPEVRESFEFFEKTEKINLMQGIPWSELVFCFGFFFVYMIEELVHACLDKKHEMLHRSGSMRKSENMCIPRVTLTKDGMGVSCITSSKKELLHSQNDFKLDLEENYKNSFSGLLAVLALSFHAIFEGLAVGLENNVDKVWYLFMAIATHKFVIAFCVGIELVTSKVRTVLVIAYIATFAVVTPLGIGMGIMLNGSGKSEQDISSVFLQGMAAGTLLYVVFFEVLSRERNKKHNGLLQLIAILVGFAVMFSLQIAIGHEHSHSHSHEESSTTAAYNV